MKSYLLSLLVARALAQSSTTTSMSMSSGMSMSMSSMSMSSAASTSSSPDYSITAEPAVASLASVAPCVFNCLNPIGLADPSGCDDVSNDCACLSAPIEAQQVITECINTVCTTNTSSYAALATSLYQSYCAGLYSNSSLASATSADSSSDAAAAASSSSAEKSSTTTSASASAASKSSDAQNLDALEWVGGFFALLILLFLFCEFILQPTLDCCYPADHDAGLRPYWERFSHWVSHFFSRSERFEEHHCHHAV